MIEQPIINQPIDAPISGGAGNNMPESQNMVSDTQPVLPADGQEVSPETQQNAPMDEQGMRRDIERNLSDVENQNNSLETKKFIAKNKIKKFKIEMLRNIFSMLQNLGIDPNNPESIKNFLLSLEQQEPDLLVLFETIFDILSPDNKTAIDDLSVPVEQPISPEQTLPPEQPISPEQTLPPTLENTNQPNLMDKYSNLQQQILR